MTSKKRVLAVALAGMLLLSSVAAAGVVRNETANESLTVTVENAGNDGATVTVTNGESAVENASVTVSATDDNATYAGADEYATDEDGTVDLPEPDENVIVAVTAEKGNLTGETTATLTAAEESDENQSFGRMVSSFVEQMLNAGDNDGPIGQVISDFVTSNNPGADKKPDHAGKPDDAGKSGNVGALNESDENGTDEKGSQGSPEHAGPGGENGNGNGNGNGHDSDDDSDEQTTTAEESS